MAASTAAAKDVMGRVGAKGPAADVARALTARLAPNLISPEILCGALQLATDSADGAWGVRDGWVTGWEGGGEGDLISSLESCEAT
jgi:hypothetical protein